MDFVGTQESEVCKRTDCTMALYFLFGVGSFLEKMWPIIPHRCQAHLMLQGTASRLPSFLSRICPKHLNSMTDLIRMPPTLNSVCSVDCCVEEATFGAFGSNIPEEVTIRKYFCLPCRSDHSIYLMR